eukprot:snap_masked-scaffold_12-processed-gene-12.47-mRNA-1 protein AED:1.00 eAED:1.00 QI:0/0/0/0/1/1/2/0/192
MSYFHVNPSHNELRELILEKTSETFNFANLHEIKALVLPDRRPISSYPKVGVHQELLEEFLDSFKDKPLLINVASFFDECIWGSKYDLRLDFVRTCYVVLEDGIIIYKRELKQFKYIFYIACMSNYLYQERDEEIKYYPFKDTEIKMKEIQDFPKRKKFTSFTIGEDSFFQTRKTFEVPKKSKENWSAKNIV